MYFPEDPTCYFWEKAYITPSVFTKGKLFFNRWIEEAVINTYYYTDSYPWMNIDAFFHWFRHSFRLFMIFFINFQCFDLFTGIKMFGLLFIHFFWFVLLTYWNRADCYVHPASSTCQNPLIGSKSLFFHILTASCTPSFASTTLTLNSS